MDTECQHSKKVENDSGDIVCIDCGFVLDDWGIVTDVQYTQDSRGVSKAVGQHVSYEG